ncbi:hypothetical protein OG897_14935 [Streptomyces sp. NBC_00237]|nr:hypothetical protein [Streptomyces sp. NBC_00237]MCX5202740.1 hypothetical protein [Streptomyces sp. NBC_00237]
MSAGDRAGGSALLRQVAANLPEQGGAARDRCRAQVGGPRRQAR